MKTTVSLKYFVNDWWVTLLRGCCAGVDDMDGVQVLVTCRRERRDRCACVGKWGDVPVWLMH